ncbi:hypothetical protein [Kitasatospora sp. P5_F3]
MKWSLIDWDRGAIELEWVVVEAGNAFRLRRLTKDGDDNALIYVGRGVMDVTASCCARKAGQEVRRT